MGFSCRRDRQSSVKGETSAISAQKYPRTDLQPSEILDGQKKTLGHHMDSPRQPACQRRRSSGVLPFRLTGVRLSTDWEWTRPLFPEERDAPIDGAVLCTTRATVIRPQVCAGGGLGEGDDLADGFSRRGA